MSHDHCQPINLSCFCCPECRGDLGWEGDGGRCQACGRSITVLGKRVVELFGTRSPAAEVIAGWSDDFIARIRPWLLDLGAKAPVPLDALAVLGGEGLIDPSSHLTNLGNKLAYHLLESKWQSADAQFHDFLNLASLGPEARVLDIGCGAGQTLRLLAPYSPTERVGIDVDLEALAFGDRLADMEEQDISFSHTTAYALPFRDGHFSHIICRVALNYMHQRNALREMVRVLQPGGFLFFRIERVWFDLWRLARARGGRELLCRLRDLGFGLVHALVGWQPAPGNRVSGGRAFGTVGRLTKILGRSHCKIVRVEANMGCPRCLGFANQITLLAKRCA
jgi:SAM-dependent methyltransferase